MRIGSIIRVSLIGRGKIMSETYRTDSRSKAKYIEQEIEKKLGIQDLRVPDEKT